MKIAVALYNCADLGGIINHTEQLIGGFKDLGHEATLFDMVFKDSASSQSKSVQEKSESGIYFSQERGWCFPKSNRLAYKSAEGLALAKRELNKHDLVIWQLPVPPKNNDNYANMLWPELYDINPKQIAVCHDGNARVNYPHILRIKDKLDALICVHECSFNATNYVNGVDRFLVMNPQKDPLGTLDNAQSWTNKRKGFVNYQNFKVWKHVDDLIKAIIEMPPIDDGENELREIAGKGIEYQYMTSQDKCKEHFYKDGKRIWDLAMDNGMRWHDYWDTNDVNSWLTMARVVVDPSWSKKYAKMGAHWNRVAVEGMMRGCVVAAQKWGMSGILEGVDLFAESDTFWVAGEHYIDLGEARDDKDYADIVLGAGNMSKAESGKIINACREKLKYFERGTVAQQCLVAAGLADKCNLGFYRYDRTEQVDYKYVNKCNRILTEQYGLESL